MFTSLPKHLEQQFTSYPMVGLWRLLMHGYRQEREGPSVFENEEPDYIPIVLQDANFNIPIWRHAFFIQKILKIVSTTLPVFLSQKLEICSPTWALKPDV